MKVVMPGVLSFSPYGGLHAQGWLFDTENDQPAPSDLLRTMLHHIAECYGVELHGCDLTRVTPDVERATLDAIAVMRWPVRDE